MSFCWFQKKRTANKIKYASPVQPIALSAKTEQFLNPESFGRETGLEKIIRRETSAEIIEMQKSADKTQFSENENRLIMENT